MESERGWREVGRVRWREVGRVRGGVEGGRESERGVEGGREGRKE